MFKIIEDPSPSVLPSPASLPGAPTLQSRQIFRPRQPDLNSGAGWPSMLYDGAQAPIFEPKVVITSNLGEIGINGTPEWPALVFNATDVSLAAGFIVSTRDGDPRWSIELGTHGPEPGGNVGTDFLINRFDDTGQMLFPRPIFITRATGKVTLGAGLILGIPPNNTLEIDPGATPADPVTIFSSSDVGIKFLDPIIIDTTADPANPPAELTISATDTALLKFTTAGGSHISSIDMGPGGSLHIGRYVSGMLVDYPMQFGPDGQVLVDGRLWVRGANVNSPFPAAPQPVLLEPPTTIGSATNNALTITPGPTAADTITLAASGPGAIRVPKVGQSVPAMIWDYGSGPLPGFSGSATDSGVVVLAGSDTLGMPVRFMIDIFNAFSSTPRFTGRAAEGSRAAPTAVTADDAIVDLEGIGYDGGGYWGGGEFRLLTRANWSSTDHSTLWELTATNGLVGNCVYRVYGDGRAEWGPDVRGGSPTLALTPDGVLSVGQATNNVLTITPGATTTDRVVLSTSGGVSGNVGAQINGPLVITRNTNALSSVTSPLGPGLWVVAPDGFSAGITMDAYGLGATYYGRRANGTLAARTALNSGDTIFQVNISGARDTANYTNQNAYIIQAAQAWTTAIASVNHIWQGAKTGTNSVVELMRLTANGNLLINTPTDNPTTAKLQVAGDVMVGLAASNKLTLSPGAATTNPIVLTQSGTGGFQINTTVGFNSTAPAAKPTISGSRANTEAALANLLTALANYGLIVNSTTA